MNPVTLSWVLLVTGGTVFGVVSTDGLMRQKGVGNLRVMVGFLFHHTIPDNAFTGKVEQYQISGACEDPLPPYLEFDQSTRTFSGFTQAEEVDSTSFICVKAVGKNQDGSIPVAKDVFSIFVDVGLTPSFACPEGDSVVLATVYTDLTLPKLEKPAILQVLDNVGSALSIAPENIRFTRFKWKYDPTRNPILYSGKGDLVGERQNQGARIQFQVGCSSEALTEDNQRVKFLRETASNGKLSNLIGYPVIEWEVAKGFPRGNAPDEE